MNYNEVCLAVLFLLQEVNIPLSAEQVSLAFPEKSGYTYMDTTSAIAKLQEQELVISETTPTGERFTINIEGRLVLSRLMTDIRGSLRKSLSEYASEKFHELSLESQVYTRCIPTGTGKFQVILRAFDKNIQMSDITLMVDDIDEAVLITHNWQKYAGEAVSSLFGILLKDAEP